MLNYWNNFDRPLPNCSCSITSPAVPSLQESGVDRRLIAGIRKRAGRPRSRVGMVHTLNREHGLHRAQEWGNRPFASLKNHSPLEGESERQGRSPQSSRRGANAASREGEPRSRSGGGLTPASEKNILFPRAPARGSSGAAKRRQQVAGKRGTLLNYWNNLDRPLPNCSCSITSPAVPSLQESGVDRRLIAGIWKRAGRPRSRVGMVHTLNREHGLHRAQEWGNRPFASLEYHSPLEGESERQGRSPQSIRRGANAASREGGPRSRAGGGLTPASEKNILFPRRQPGARVEPRSGGSR